MIKLATTKEELMNCPKCGNPLQISKKDPQYGLCYNCKKKFRLPQTAQIPVSLTKNETLSDETKILTSISSSEKSVETNKADNQHSAPTKKKKTVKKRVASQTGYYTEDQYENEPSHKKKKYANIPPSKVRSTREDDMRSSYDELLSIKEEKQSIGSKILTFLLIILILALIGIGGFYLYNYFY